MQISCYIEVDIICLVLSAIIYLRLRQNRNIHSTSQIIMRWLIVSLWVMCVSDIFAIVYRGRPGSSAHAIVEASNIIYISSMVLVSMIWYFYVRNRVGRTLSRRNSFLHMLPMVAFAILAITNPLHNFLFTVSDQNIYSRGPGIFLHWIFAWYYMCYACFLSAKAVRSASSWSRRNEYKPLLLFLILPAIGGASQILLYGVNSLQAGITLSIVLVFQQIQNSQISIDELTGANNRKAMRNYVESLLHQAAPPELTVSMIDINKFKRINDTLGHSVGDEALCCTTDILRSVCSASGGNLFLCRYGGDEFVIIGRNMTPEAVKQMREEIHRSTGEFCSTRSKPYKLSVSIGTAGGVCESYDDFEHYLRMADEAMYDEKKRRS